MTTSLRLMTPVKSTASLASLAFDSPLVESAPIEVRQGATSTLRDIQIAQRRIQSARESPTTPKQPWWPSIASWSMSTPRQTVQNTTAFANSAHQTQHRSLPHEYESASKKEMRKPQLRIVASSPQLHSHLASPPPSSRSSSRLLPFEPKEAIASIDPELAALELASALTKHVQCSVCGADGVNFPNCRKCGLTFCSRPCRIDEKGAGNGKRYVMFRYIADPKTCLWCVGVAQASELAYICASQRSPTRHCQLLEFSVAEATAPQRVLGTTSLPPLYIHNTSCTSTLRCCTWRDTSPDRMQTCILDRWNGMAARLAGSLERLCSAVN